MSDYCYELFLIQALVEFRTKLRSNYTILGMTQKTDPGCAHY